MGKKVLTEKDYDNLAKRKKAIKKELEKFDWSKPNRVLVSDFKRMLRDMAKQPHSKKYVLKKRVNILDHLGALENIDWSKPNTYLVDDVRRALKDNRVDYRMVHYIRKTYFPEAEYSDTNFDYALKKLLRLRPDYKLQNVTRGQILEDVENYMLASEKPTLSMLLSSEKRLGFKPKRAKPKLKKDKKHKK